jgi:hypothetical protein
MPRGLVNSSYSPLEKMTRVILECGPARRDRSPNRLLFQSLYNTRRPVTLFMIVQEFIEEGKLLPELSAFSRQFTDS